MPEISQIQPPQDTPRVRPDTNDPVWHLLFDRLDAQDDNIKTTIHNTVVIATEQERLRAHVNDEQEKFSELLATTVRKGEVISDLIISVRKSRPAQLVLFAVIVAMAPVIAANWTALVESIRRFV